MRTRPLATVLLAGMLVVASIGPAGASPPGPETAADLTQAAGQPAAAADRITLVTGDRVTLTGDGNLAVHRGAGREHIQFAISRAGEHRYAIPSDAVPLLAAGRLDRRLFDVALLRDLGDHARNSLPLIVSGDGGLAAARSTATAAGARVARDLPAVGGAAVRVDHARAAGFWRDLTGSQNPGVLGGGVEKIWLDGLRQPSLDQSVPQVGAPAAWAAGLDGTGVTVAVLDTGIDATHPDLSDRVVGQKNFTEEFEDDRDLVGHGTHVASTLAGTGAASGGQLRGVAHGAGLLDGKVCVEFGCAESWIIAGMQWAAEQGAAVVNMSLGGPDFPGLDPVEQALADLTAEPGVLFVVAAGNDGADGSINSPASTDSALAVGAVDKADQLAPFSSRGPRIDGALKPDLTAPGVDIVAANSKDGFLGQPGEPYTTLSGTSMATPHAAGAAAILVQQHPDWSPQQLKAALMGAAAPHSGLPVTAQGAGRLDVARAIGQPVSTGPASVSFDRQSWPHDDDQPQTETVTYRNHGDAEVTLALAVTAAGPGGEPAPAGMFVASPPTVTIPAGGTGQASLTADTRVGTEDGYLGGHLIATAGDLVVQTPFGVDREPESYDVTLSHLDRDGAPTSSYFTVLVALDGSRSVEVFGPPEVTVRVPAGEYFLGSFVDSLAGGTTVLVQPRLAVAGDLTVPVNASTGAPVSVGVPDDRAVPVFVSADAALVTDQIIVGFGALADPGRLFTARLDPPDPVDGLITTVTGALARPGRDGALEDSRTVYNLAWFLPDEFPTGFDRVAQRRELAQVRADHAVQVAGSDAFKTGLALHPDTPFASGVGIPIALPQVRTEFFRVGEGVEWENLLDELIIGDESFEDVILLHSNPIAYQPGRLHRERWNYGVFGPTAAQGEVFRTGDELIVAPVLYADGAGQFGFAPATGAIRVFRDGELITEAPSPEFASVLVPPEPADYRVEVEAERLGSAPLSARTTVSWQFRSEHVDDDAFVALPAAAVRFRPPLAPDNTARAGLPLLVPVSVEAAPDAGPGDPDRLTVEVSFDDGASWRPAPVLLDRFVLVQHPPGDGFVSFRATATDRDGNRVEQTVLRAYEIS